METVVTLYVDGIQRSARLDTRTTILDALRETFGVTAPKKGCDHGQCGACTVLLDGRRVNACLMLAVAYDGAEITTAAGLARDGLHPLQQAFIDHDGFQCGYCTPGQICSAVGMLEEIAAGAPSNASPGCGSATDAPTDADLRERMSGNLCRCGAYPNILTAIRAVLDAPSSSPAGGE